MNTDETSINKKSLMPRTVIIKAIVNEDFNIEDSLFFASQSFIYHILTNNNKKTAEEIHDRERGKEFTLRPFTFYPKGQYDKEKRSLYIKKDTRAILEVKTHTDSLYQQLINGISNFDAKLLKHKIDIYEKEQIQDFRLINIDEKDGCPERVSLDIITPMWFRLPHSKENLEMKSQNYRTIDKRVRFPDPVLLYKSLRSQILSYTGYENTVPDLIEFTSSLHIDKIIHFNYEKIKTKRENGKLEEDEGFVGKIIYFIDGENILRNKIYNFLRLGTYFGIGARISMGCGQFEVHAKNFRSLIPNTSM